MDEKHDQRTQDSLPLVLLHGFPFDGGIWRGQVDELKGSVDVYTPDLPGFGNADPLSVNVAPSMEAYADSIAEWARSEGLNKFALGGHSMGGYVAFAFARKYPELVSALVLICTRPGADSETAREGRFKLAAEVEKRGPQAVVDAMLPKLLAPDNSSGEAADQTLEAIRRQSDEGIIAALHAMAARPDSTADLEEITIPTLIITGEHDAIIPAPEAEAMLDRLPGAKHVVVSDSGHMPMLENRRDFSAALRRFLAESC